MSQPRAASPRHTGRLIAALLAIPVGSVSTAALVADVASTTDPSAAVSGLVATLMGVALGACVLRVIGAISAGVTALFDAVQRLAAAGEALLDPSSPPFSPAPALRPARAFIPASVGRRGPPSRRR